MRYIVSEVQYDSGVQRTAGTKARNDVETILSKEGYKKITIEKKIKKSELKFKSISYHFSCFKEWKNAFLKTKIEKDDEVVIQFPPINHTLFFAGLIKKYVKKGATIKLLIHDMEILRTATRDDISLLKKIRINFEEKKTLKAASSIIVHNSSMLKKLISLGITKDKLINLKIFDYLIEDKGKIYKNRLATKDDPVIIAGALRKHKAGYVYNLPSNVNFNLYGVGYDDSKKDNINYFGSYPADNLPFELFGSFGLVWDGMSSETCKGSFGEYLRINNPHKTSLYLASGIPVIIWSKAALAEFIEKNKCGITVDSLYEIADKLKSMTDKEYEDIKKNVQAISPKLKNGYYTKKSIEA